AKDTLCIGALLHRRQIFDWKHHALVLISYVKNLRNRRSLLLPLRGFTLAEVLITLGIIGVVAALTIPTLMQKTNERETISNLKKVYSELSQSWNMMQVEYGTIDKWGLNRSYTGELDENGKQISDRNAQNLLVERWTKYLNVSKFCSETSSCGEYNIYSLGGVNQGTTEYNNPWTFILNDGTLVIVGWYGGVNTPSEAFDIRIILPKSKNAVQGKNYFYFSGKSKGLIPSGNMDDTAYTFNYTCKNNSDKSFGGCGCTAWIIYNDNMDFLHCPEQLSWNGKTKCD
ncbi:prepilin-type N-terminal cleavage/methylation domain-containing protein, partial [bacterium]|nr:prepilin-type N-terminal cleavage/methylation domain-containing protein [bacterium]